MRVGCVVGGVCHRALAATTHFGGSAHVGSELPVLLGGLDTVLLEGRAPFWSGVGHGVPALFKR